MRYILQSPSGNDYEITRYVLRGAESITELAFDLESAVIPSDLDIEVDNIDGVFDPQRGLISEGELTRFLVIVKSDDLKQVLFLGMLADVRYRETTLATLETRSVIARLMNCSFNMSSVSGWGPVVVAPPARLVADLLGPNGLHLPGIFIDGPLYEQAAAAEQNLGIAMRLAIPAGEEMRFVDFLQELNRVSGAYVYSHNGYIRYARMGGFARPGYDFTFAGQILAGTTQVSRPVLWQKTKVSALYWDGAEPQKLTKTMIDYFDVIGESIMEEFQEKSIDSDGLRGWLVHANQNSAEAGLQDVLSWRGFPRYQFEFETDALGLDVRNQAQAIPLLARVRLMWSGGCAQIVITEKTTSEHKAVIKGLSLNDPVFVHPALRRYPAVRQDGGHTLFINNTGHDLDIEYRIGDAGAKTRTTIGAGETLDLENYSYQPVIYRVFEGLPCGELPSAERTFAPDITGHFILGVSFLGDTIG
jgi:hypothetical protein